jgi:LysM repeat protein
MKKSLLACLMSLCALVGFAQADLVVHNNGKGLFLNHTVSPKENFYSIGRLYNIPAKDIATTNSLDMNNGLSVGQTLMIPLQASNFTQVNNNGTPVYYVVGEREGLYRVSLKNNGVLMANLRKWNNLATDNISVGQKLIVGYVTSSELASYTPAAAPVREQTVAEEKPKAQPQPVQTETAKKAEPEPVKPQPTQTASTSSSSTVRPQQAVVRDGNGGYFKSQYDQQTKAGSKGKESMATSGIFKTASGWQDAKYYALIDGVEPGTIIQVVNPQNNKAIYAKVLGAMSGISQNKGLDLRVSNAAANVLEISDTEKFVVRVNY